ncbi:MAG: hypothetical protein ACREF4_11815 [Gammaproteobacteria bacterium]
MAVISGDIVRYGANDWIVVDLVDEQPPMVVLRTDDDPDLLRPLAVMAAAVEVRGHLEHLDGWVEDSPGIWSQT